MNTNELAKLSAMISCFVAFIVLLALAWFMPEGAFVWVFLTWPLGVGTMGIMMMNPEDLDRTNRFQSR